MNFIDGMDNPQPKIRQSAYFILVMNQHPEACARAFQEHGFGHLYRTADSEAETRAFSDP